MARAPYHTLGDQLAPGRPEGGDFPVELVGDVTGTMGPLPEFGHGAEVALFEGRQPIESHAEEALVQGGDARARCRWRRFIASLASLQYAENIAKVTQITHLMPSLPLSRQSKWRDLADRSFSSRWSKWPDSLWVGQPVSYRPVYLGA